MSKPENAFTPLCPCIQPPNRKTRGKATKTNKAPPTKRRAAAEKRKHPMKNGSTKTSVVVPKRDKAKNSKLKPQSDWRQRNFNRLPCPVFLASANPDPECFKSCYNGVLDISHIREHLKKHHACDRDCQQNDPAILCSNPMHLSSEKLVKIKTVFKQRHESDGDIWGRIYQELYPGRKIPVPYLISVDQVEAVAHNPSEGFKAKLTRVLEESDNDSAKFFQAFFNVEDCLSLVLMVLGVIRETGASPDLARREE